jgi:cytochrome b
LTEKRRKPTADGRRAAIAVWDWQIRIFHWSLVCLVGLCWYSGERDDMQTHLMSGYAIIALLIFRLYWGLFGSNTARFMSFVRGPATVAAYARRLLSRSASHEAGHNPLGALSIVALLATLAGLVGFGLFSVDVDGLESGPLADRVSFDVGRKFAHLHHAAFNVLEALVVLHLAAVAFYLVARRTNLIGPMITGRAKGVDGEGLKPAPLWRAVIGAALAIGLAGLIAHGLRLKA